MKKPLLFIALLIGSLTQLNAQCTIMASCTPDPISGYCTTPPDNTSLPNATESSPYSTTIQMSIGTSALGGGVTITSASLTSVTGLPTGLSYSSNPTNGFVPAGSDACLLISGTPVMGTAGSFIVDVNFDIVSSFGSGSQAVSWTLDVDAAGTVGIKSITSVSNLVISPNPASNELFVSSASHFGKVQIVDVLGKVVLSHDANYTSQTVIDISSLNKGVYFLQISDGKTLSTKKFIKD